MLGNVHDPQGRPVKGLKLTFTDIGGRRIRVRTDGEGIYSAKLTPYKPYSVSLALRKDKRVVENVRPQCGAGALNFRYSKDTVVPVVARVTQGQKLARP